MGGNMVQKIWISKSFILFLQLQNPFQPHLLLQYLPIVVLNTFFRKEMLTFLFQRKEASRQTFLPIPRHLTLSRKFYFPKSSDLALIFTWEQIAPLIISTKIIGMP